MSLLCSFNMTEEKMLLMLPVDTANASEIIFGEKNS